MIFGSGLKILKLENLYTQFAMRKYRINQPLSLELFIIPLLMSSRSLLFIMV